MMYVDMLELAGSAVYKRNVESKSKWSTSYCCCTVILSKYGWLNTKGADLSTKANMYQYNIRTYLQSSI